MVNRPRSQLQEEQKKHIVKFYDDKPFATTDEAVESLIAAFEGFSLKRTTVDNFIIKECNLSMKKLSRQPKARNDIRALIVNMNGLKSRQKQTWTMLKIAFLLTSLHLILT